MSISKRNLYTLVLLGCLAGYVWLWANTTGGSGGSELGVCLIKHTTGVPCPSCGSTRSVVSLLGGHVGEALYWNPLGLLVLLIIVVCPLWIGFDTGTGRDSFHRFYLRMETVLQRRRVAIPVAAMVLINWAWNIYKGL